MLRFVARVLIARQHDLPYRYWGRATFRAPAYRARLPPPRSESAGPRI